MMDPSKLDKLKVVELRAQLSSRGLDSKGVKAVLVERLKKALELELNEHQQETCNTEENSIDSNYQEATSEDVLCSAEEESSFVDEPEDLSKELAQEYQEYKDDSIHKEVPEIENTQNESSVSALNEESDEESKDNLNEQTEEKYNENLEAMNKNSVPEQIQDSVLNDESAVEDSNVNDEFVVEDSVVNDESVVQDSVVNDESVDEEKTIIEQEDNKRTRESQSDDDEDEPAAKKCLVESEKTTGEEKSVSNGKSTEKQQKTLDDNWDGESDTEMKETENINTTEGEHITKSTSKKSFSKSRSRSRTRKYSKSSRSVASHSKSRSRSRSRHRHRSSRYESRKSPALNTDDFTNEEDEPVIKDKQFGLSWFDSDLHLRIDSNTFNSARPLKEDIFEIIWSGARSNYGVKEGKVAFEVRLSEEMSSHSFRSEKNLHGFRCGFSTSKASLFLGEDENSFAFCENGKKVTSSEFSEYGKPFKLDDVIGCYLDLESSPCKIEFTVNGEPCGTAFEFEKEILGENEALFPHVLTKGYEFEVNFMDDKNLLLNKKRVDRREKKEDSISSKDLKDEKKNEDDPVKKDDDNNTEECLNDNLENKTEEKGDESAEVNEENTITKNDENNKKSDSDDNKGHENQQQLLPGYTLVALIPDNLYISGPQRPQSRKDCEVLLMVGLPGSGKTHWVLNYLKEHPQNHYDLIGIDHLIEKMKIDGKSRKDVHIGKWEEVYESCSKCLRMLEDIANKRRRNYILDQSNVYASDQRRKMKGFGDFKRIAVVCIPNEDELKRRSELLTVERGFSFIKESAINRMKANFTLPSVEFGWFDEVRYTDLKDDEAKEVVKNYNEKGKKAVDKMDDSSKYKRHHDYRRDDRHRHDDRRRFENRGGSRWSNDHRSHSRWGPQSSTRSGGNNWRDDRGYGGGYDRRNDRYSSGMQNWGSGNRQRYDDRFYRSGGSSGNSGRKYDYGNDRSYRDHRYEREKSDRKDSRYSSGGNQRDFRSGHRGDHRSEDSRGGSERSSSKYMTDSNYDSKSGNSKNSGANINQWGGPAQQNPPQQAWNMGGQPQSYWGGYDSQPQNNYDYNNQQQWAINVNDPRQQQWVNWWPQDGNASAGNPQSQQQSQQYWAPFAQHSYPQQGLSSGGHMNGNMRNDSKK